MRISSDIGSRLTVTVYGGKTILSVKYNEKGTVYMADQNKRSREVETNNVGDLSVSINVDTSEAITGLKAVQREAREATKALKELEEVNERVFKRMLTEELNEKFGDTNVNINVNESGISGLTTKEMASRARKGMEKLVRD